MEMVVEPAAKRLKLSVSGITLREDSQTNRNLDNADISGGDLARKQSFAIRHDKASKVEMMQKKLTSLLHARSCKGLCTNTLCPQMKIILNHLDECVAGKDCPDSQCRSVRQMLLHFKTCRKSDCDLCLAVRIATEGSNQSPVPKTLQPVTDNHEPSANGLKNVPVLCDQTGIAAVNGCTSIVKHNGSTTTANEICRLFMPTWKIMYNMPTHSLPFRHPVDTSFVPDYLTVIKRPIDLSTIHKKLESGQYENPWHYIEDVQLMFENAWLYNKKTSPVYKSCTKLAEKFESVIDEPMKKLGYCCGQRPIFRPLVMYCFSHLGCTIPIYGAYYNYEDLYAFCEKCFNSAPGNTIEVHPDGLSQNVVNLRKDQFKRVLNNRHDPEPYVLCKCCDRRQHQICILHTDQIWPTGYVCDSCLREQKLLKKQNLYTANKLVNTKLGAYLEDRVNSFLHRRGVIESGHSEGVVTIRVLSSSEKIAEVKPGMRSRFPDAPSGFPYTSKSIFAFQNVEGVDMCFFGMHVQEYGSDCPAPNQRRVYLAYLDSVNLFRPKMYRTTVYQELLIGYMKYVRSLGYLSVHIWACPPGDTDDYIFHRHPDQQKIPKPKRLQDWYRKILDRASAEGIVDCYKDIVSDSSAMSSVTELPYFDGDYWPNVLEEAISAEQQEEAAVDEQTIVSDVNQKEKLTIKGPATTTTTGKAKKNGKVKKSSKCKKTLTWKGVTNKLIGRVLSTMEKHKEVFFVVHLQAPESQQSVPSIEDPDICLQGDLMDGRVPFLQFCSDQRLEFSSLRRAKFSSMVLLYELHSEQETGVSRSIFTCRMCIRKTTVCYSCQECENMNMCSACYDRAGHQHQMTKRGGEGDDSIVKCIETLAHASQCSQDESCPEKESCRRMANVLLHARQCSLRNSCPVCRQLVALCVTHSRKCPVPVGEKCPVPFCAELRVDLDRRRQEQRRHQQQMVDCRLAVMTASQSSDRETSNGLIEEVGRPGPLLDAACSSKRSSNQHSKSKFFSSILNKSPTLSGAEEQPLLIGSSVETEEVEQSKQHLTDSQSPFLSEKGFQSLEPTCFATPPSLSTTPNDPRRLYNDHSCYALPIELAPECSDKPVIKPSSDAVPFDALSGLSAQNAEELSKFDFSPDSAVGGAEPMPLSNSQYTKQRSADIDTHRRDNRQLADIVNQLPAKSAPSSSKIREVASSLRAAPKSFQSSYSEFLVGSSATTHIYIQSSNGSKTIVQFNSGDAGPINSNELLAHLADRL